jgi:hypothetical protein
MQNRLFDIVKALIGLRAIVVSCITEGNSSAGDKSAADIEISHAVLRRRLVLNTFKAK